MPPLKTALVIDDNNTSREMLKTTLNYFGIDCHTAGNMIETFAILQQLTDTGNIPELILIDHKMPDIDGLGLANEIKKMPELKNVPQLLMINSLEKNIYQSEADRAGIYKLITKPVKTYELYAAICSLFVPLEAPMKKIREKEQLSKASGNSQLVMVVEDDLINMMLITEVLKKMGYSIIKANNGKEALEILPQHNPGIIFMDINMPEMDGFETTRFIRKMPAPAGTTPIIALTADAMTGDKEKCIEAGMNSYISKPFRLEEIQEVLETVFVKNNPDGKQGQGKKFATNA